MATPQNGIVAVRVSGDPIRIKGAVTYALGGKVREAIEGPLGLVGFKVSGNAGFVEVVSVDAADVNIADLQEMEGETITAQLENGKTIVLNDASTVGLLEVNTEEGEFTVRFVGESAKEI